MENDIIFGYLDPGSGSLLLQAVLGGIAGIAVAFRAWRTRLLSRASRRRPAAEATEGSTGSKDR